MVEQRLTALLPSFHPCILPLSLPSSFLPPFPLHLLLPPFPLISFLPCFLVIFFPSLSSILPSLLSSHLQSFIPHFLPSSLILSFPTPSLVVFFPLLPSLRPFLSSTICLLSFLPPSSFLSHLPPSFFFYPLLLLRPSPLPLSPPPSFPRMVLVPVVRGRRRCLSAGVCRRRRSAAPPTASTPWWVSLCERVTE